MELLEIYLILLIFVLIYLLRDKIVKMFNFIGSGAPKIDENNYSYLCPNCGSTNVEWDLSKEMIAWKGITRKRCGKI